MRNSYETDAKRAVTDFFKNNKEHHFTVDEVCDSLLSEGFEISKSTVYRRISKLFEGGIIRRFESPGCNSFVYQYADYHSECHHHFHLKCESCGRLVHMDCNKMQEIKKHIFEEHGFVIGGAAVINGLCSACSEGGSK